jgi:hypothetical protein
MLASHTKKWLLTFVAVGLMAVPAAAQASETQELEDFLFVQNAYGRNAGKAVYVLWIPQPVQKVCMGKTAQQCIQIDFCVRTTNKKDASCQNLGVTLPSYPRDMRPRRVLSVTYFPAAPIQGMDMLWKYFQSPPATAFDRLSMGARIKARIKMTRSADDDQFEMIEVLAVPPL